VDHGLDNGVTVVVNERQRARLVGNCEGELIVVDQADLFNLGRVEDVVQKNRVRQNFGFLGARDLNCSWADLIGKTK